jgi:signal transduction histidine kinase
MAVVLLGVAGFVYAHVRADLRATVDMGLRSRAQVIGDNASHPGVRIGGGPGQHRLIDADEAFAQVLTAAGQVAETTPAVREAPLVSPTLLATVHGPTFVNVTPPGLDPARLLVVKLAAGSTRGYAVVGATLSNSQDALGTLVTQLEIALPAALLISTAVVWFVAGAALRPVERMRRQAEDISATDPTRRLPIPRTNDTLARLATTLNTTFDRLQAALERERSFVNEASHELRTPLTILKAEIDSALARPATPDQLHQALRSANEEVEHLVRIAEGLLVLARAGNGRIPIYAEDVDLRTLIDTSLAAFAVRAAARDVALDAHSSDAVVHLDPTRTRQALDNLIDNAIRHSRPGGAVCVRATAEDGHVTVVVQDDGEGFEPGLLDRPFQAFHRGRRTTYPGSGLGLAIVAAVADAHHGTAIAENPAGGGARITLTLPNSTARQAIARGRATSTGKPPSQSADAAEPPTP